MKKAINQGYLSESWAMFWLRLKGIESLYHRYKTRHGEIDIIGQNEDTLVFVEVKYRQHWIDSDSILTPKQEFRLYQAAEYFLSQHPFPNVRFDVILFRSFTTWDYWENITLNNNYKGDHYEPF